MSDLIERLRPNPDDYNQKLRMEAADEIERLTEQNKRQVEIVEFADARSIEDGKKIERLQAKVGSLEGTIRRLHDRIPATEQDLRQPSPLKDVDTFTSDSTNEQGGSDE